MVDQSHDVSYEKGDYSYLLFYNEEKEKVVLKFHGQERDDPFLESQNHRVFLKDSDVCPYSYPMGRRIKRITPQTGWAKDALCLSYCKTKRDIFLPAIN